VPVADAATAYPIPDERAPVGSRNSVAPSPVVDCAITVRAPASATNHRARSACPLKWRRLINEHDGDAISNRVAQPARVAEECRLGLAILELTFALRTNEDG
jgi:hypothetical protein